MILYVVLSPRFSPRIYSSKLFFPDEHRGDMKALRSYGKYQNAEIPFLAQDGFRMRGWYFANTASKKIYLVHQGNSGDIPRHMEIIDLLLESGASVFIYDPRGFGESAGKPTIQHWLEDAESAYDVVNHQLHFTAEQIIIFGISLGSAAATHLSTVRPARGLILQSGFSSLEAIAKEEVKGLRIYPSFLFTRPAFDNARILSGSHPPLLLVHGLKDDVIGPDHTRTMYFAASEPKSVLYMQDSNHTEVAVTDRPKYLQTLKMFLASL
ncbi:MAG: alpha/beta fold hydrolase [Leptolyngbya sp.]|nr:alpha/beta fold hydrolase [Candidatus Melainabacteria bacterium]